MFRPVGVFVGGWTVSAAEAICAGAESTGPQDAPVAARTDRHLPRRGRRAGWSGALPLAGDAACICAGAVGGERGAGRNSAAARTLLSDLATHSLPRDLWGTKHELFKLDREHGNFLSALARSTAVGELQVSCQLAGVLWRFWWGRGRAVEVRPFLTDLLQKLRALPRGVAAGAQAKAFLAGGMLAHSQGDTSEALPLLEVAVECSRHSNEPALVSECLQGLAMLLQEHASEYDRAVYLLEESLGFARQENETELVAEALMNLGLAHHGLVRTTLRARHWKRAYVCAAREQAAALAPLSAPWATSRSINTTSRRRAPASKSAPPARRELNDRQSLAFATASLGELALAQGDYARARGRFVEALEIWQNNDEESLNRGSISFVLMCFAWLAVRKASPVGLRSSTPRQ